MTTSTFEVVVRIAPDYILHYGGGALTHQNVLAVKVTDANSLVLEGNGTTVVYSHGVWTSFNSKEVVAEPVADVTVDLGGKAVVGGEGEVPTLPTKEGGDKVVAILKDAATESGSDVAGG